MPSFRCSHLGRASSGSLASRVFDERNFLGGRNCHSWQPPSSNGECGTESRNNRWAVKGSRTCLGNITIFIQLRDRRRATRLGARTIIVRTTRQRECIAGLMAACARVDEATIVSRAACQFASQAAVPWDRRPPWAENSSHSAGRPSVGWRTRCRRRRHNRRSLQP